MKMWQKFKNSKLCKGWCKLINDLKPMNWKQRLDHIWTYYKEYTYVVLFVMIALSLVVTIVVNQTQETIVSGMLVNSTMRQEGYNYLTEDYKQILAPDDKNKLVDLDYTTFGDPMDPETGENSYYASMILTARVSGQMLDYVIMDKFAMEYYMSVDVYLDLREFFTPEELEQLAKEDRIIYVQEEGDEDRMPVVVDISDIPFVKDNITSEGKTYFALSGNVRSLETCRGVWEYLNAWESKEE